MYVCLYLHVQVTSRDLSEYIAKFRPGQKCSRDKPETWIWIRNLDLCTALRLYHVIALYPCVCVCVCVCLCVHTCACVFECTLSLCGQHCVLNDPCRLRNKSCLNFDRQIADICNSTLTALSPGCWSPPAYTYTVIPPILTTSLYRPAYRITEMGKKYYFYREKQACCCFRWKMVREISEGKTKHHSDLDILNFDCTNYASEFIHEVT